MLSGLFLSLGNGRKEFPSLPGCAERSAFQTRKSWPSALILLGIRLWPWQSSYLLSGPHFYLGTGNPPPIGSGCYDIRQRQRQPQAREGSPGERALGNEESPGFVVETTEYAPFSLESVSPAAL